MFKLFGMFGKLCRDINDYDVHPLVSVLLAVLIFAIAIAIAGGLFALQCWLIMILWNWVAVGLFSLPALTFWYAVGLRLLWVWLFGDPLKVDAKSDDE